MARLRVLSALLLLATPFVAAFGCNNCLSKSVDDIRYGCLGKCSDAFGPTTSEYRQCESECTTFVFDQHCCTASCTSSDQCLRPLFSDHVPTVQKRDAEEGYAALEKIKRDPKLLDTRALVVRDAPYNLVRSTEQLRSLNPRAFRSSRVFYPNAPATDISRRDEDSTSLDARADPGQVCCKVAQTVLSAGAAKLGIAYTQLTTNANISDEDRVAGIVLISFGAASSFACSRIYQINCIFDGRPTQATPTQ